MNFRRYRELDRGEFIVCFADTAAGGIDYCAAQFLSKDKVDVPIIYHAQTIATEMTPALHHELERIYEATGVQPVVCFERNNGGVYRLAGLNRNGKYLIYQEKKNVGSTDSTVSTPKLGWTTNSATRPVMLSMLKDAIDTRLLTIYDRPTINEMFAFVVVQTSSSWKAQAESGAHDDLIMSLAGAWQMYQTEERPIDYSRVTMPSEKLFDSDGFYI